MSFTELLETSYMLQRDICMTNGVQTSQSCFQSGNTHDVLVQHPTRAQVDSLPLIPVEDLSDIGEQVLMDEK